MTLATSILSILSGTATASPSSRLSLSRALCCAAKILTASAWLLAAGTAAAQPATTLQYTDILRQLADLDRLTHLQAGCQGGLFSSWDRRSRTAWGANGDAGQYLRVEPNGEAVMMECDGPGVVYRTWSANPMGKIRLYLDGATTPTYEWNFPDLFDGKLPPFIQPLVYRRDQAQSASDCYLPIPFAKHIKITADKAHSQYYHFNYVRFPQDRPVASFHLPLTPEEQRVLTEVADLWSHPGRDPKPRLAGQTTIATNLTLPPGGVVVLADLRQPGVIRAVRARVQSDQRYAWRKLVLRGQWDGADWPQVLTPLGPFFGFDWDTAEYGSVPAGCLGGRAYNYFPMPFTQSARISLQSFLEQAARVELEIEWAPLSQLPPDMVYFYARWHHEPDLMAFEYPFLETAGRGHFVGVAMPIEHPLDGWWGEGDEKVWVDDDDFPPYIGTGSEDYFGDAWGIRYLSGPSFGASSMKGHRTCNYRWHFTDFIPFTKRMRMTIENYGPNGRGPRGQYDYSSTAFWYQAERTPPFAQLRDVAYTGGDDPNGPPSRKQYNARVFPDLNPETLRTYGTGIPFAQQAEELAADQVRAGRAQIVTDAMRAKEFDREQAVDFGNVAAGKKLADLKLTVPSDGVYRARIYPAAELGLAELALAEGTNSPSAEPSERRGQPASLFLTKGERAVTLVAASSGRAIFDCLQLESAPRVSGAIEAEELTVVRTTGGASAPHPSAPCDGVSAGRLLQFSAQKEGQGLVLRLGHRPALPYVLGLRPMLGPKAGIVQAFAAEKPIGPTFDLYAPERAPGPTVLPLGSVPAGVTELEVRITGRNPATKGMELELDYLRWEPVILGPGTAAGIWAQVSETHGCNYEPQDLGAAYSDGHQFWVQPCNKQGWVDIAVHIAEAREYEILAKFTHSWDYATIQAFLDGTALGPKVDTYAATVTPGTPVTLGKLPLSAGRHLLRFQAVDHHPQSKGYLMGIDHVVIR